MGFGAASGMRAAFLAGAADYLREPWTAEELDLRLALITRRQSRQFQFSWGTLRLEGLRLQTRGGALRLTVSEARLLRALLLSRGTPVPRQALGYMVWNRGERSGSRALDVQVSCLRRKLAPVFPVGDKIIRAVRHQGYVLE